MELTQGSTTPIPFYLALAADHISPATGKLPLVFLSKAGGAFAVVDVTTVTETGNGWYRFTPTSAHTDTAGPLLLHATAALCDPADDQHVVGLDSILQGSTIPICFFHALTSDHLTGAEAKSPSVTISKAGAAFAAPAGAVAEIAFGWYKLTPTAVDTNTLGALALHATAAACDPADDLFFVEALAAVPPATVVAAPLTLPLTSDPSAVQICNLALAQLGNSDFITELSESSASARACNLFFAQVRDEVLEAFPWPFATRFPTLAVVATSPTTEWAFSYRYPVGALAVRRLLSGVRVDTRASRVPYRLGDDDTGKLLYTDLADAQAEVTMRVTDPTRFSPTFVEAFALKLAAVIAPMVTGGDPQKLGARAFQLYQLAIGTARARHANEEQPDVEPESEYISARN